MLFSKPPKAIRHTRKCSYTMLCSPCWIQMHRKTAHFPAPHWAKASAFASGSIWEDSWCPSSRLTSSSVKSKPARLIRGKLSMSVSTSGGTTMNCKARLMPTTYFATSANAAPSMPLCGRTSSSASTPSRPMSPTRYASPARKMPTTFSAR